MIYLFKNRQSGKIVNVNSEPEAGDLLFRKSIYTGEKEFEYLGRITQDVYSAKIGQVKKAIEERIAENSTQKQDNEGHSFTVSANDKEMRKIREEEKEKYQTALKFLAKKADKTLPKKEDWIYMDEKARLAVEGSRISL